MSIGYTVIGGYLGAGKTTLLNRLLQHADGQRLALIINDFGAINIDAQLIASRTDKQINLTNGCVCCGLSDGFDAAMDDLLETLPVPDHIVVEASGVADVSVLAQYGQGPGLHLTGVVVLADAETVRAKARDKYVANTVQRQLRAADIIVLNKIDLVSPAALAATRAWLGTLAPHAELLNAVNAQVPADVVLGTFAHRRAPGTNSSELAQEAHAGHERYVTWALDDIAELTADQVAAFLQALPAAVIRGKGFFPTTSGVQLWQRVGRRDSLTPAGADAGRGVVVIAVEAALIPDSFNAMMNELATRHLGAAGQDTS